MESYILNLKTLLVGVIAAMLLTAIIFRNSTEELTNAEIIENSSSEEMLFSNQVLQAAKQ